MQTESDNHPANLYDLGCRWPECECSIPWYAWSHDIRKQYCKFGYLLTQKGKNMSDYEIKETILQTGYVDKDGKFVPESDPSKAERMTLPKTFVQSDEDVVL